MYPSYSPLFTLGLLAERHDDKPVYFTLHTRKRDSAKLRSFLYLDLADRRPHPPSHRRKFSTLSKSTSWTCTPDAKSFYGSAHAKKPAMIMSPIPVRRRTSKESLRNIPSPKPAPSATLPDLPAASGVCFLPSSAPGPSSQKRSASAFVTPLLSPASRIQRPASLRSESVSSHDRRRSRMDALACLEGRALHRLPRSSSRRNNFMSLSDDEDDGSKKHKSPMPSVTTMPVVHIEDLSAFADVEDEVDAIVPTVTRKKGEVLGQSKPSRRTIPGRRRRGTIESWFPLKSFIDLKDDDLSSWNWRSFIEVGGVS